MRSPSTGRPKRSGGLALLFPLLFLGNVAVYEFLTGTGTLAAFEVGQLGGPGAWGVVATFAGLSAALGPPVSGALSDRTRSRFGRRNPWLLGTSLATLISVLLLTGAPTSVVLIGIGYCVAQTFAYGFHAILTVIVPDRVPREKRGTASAVSAAGLAVGTVAGTQVAAALSSSSAYLTLGAAVVVGAVLLVAFTRDPRPEPRLAEAPAVTAAARGPVRRAAGFFSALAEHDFRWVFVGRTLMSLCYFMVTAFIVFVLSDYIVLPAGMPVLSAVAAVTLIDTGAAALAALAGGWLSDRLQRCKVFVFASSALFGLSLLIPVLTRSWHLYLVTALLHGIAYGTYLAVDTSLATLVLAKARDFGRDLGIINLAQAIPQIAAPAVAAGIVALGGYRLLFGAAIAVGLLAAASVLPIRSVR
ncbi:MFS transporter [Amycolatopsis halotolerans]|uniref:MFS transporter n=1 Tax=Amycolatopsis halotolerans TaxID=330083 RepID=A0ABV7QAX9_9PSEU